jgi:predicted O-linked N-acetylglucosamine transferase (SPINDLY family)
MNSPEATFAAAVQHHQRGELSEAARMYRAVLADDPEHVDALRFLGAIAHQLGDLVEAIDSLGRAAALRPNVAALHNHHAAALLAAGRFEEAAAGCHAAIWADANYAPAHLNLGNVFHRQGRLADAAACYQTAVQIKPDYVDALNNLGLALAGLGRLDDAIVCYRRAIEIQPQYAGAYLNLANALNAQAKIEQAIEACRRAAALAPQFVTAHANLGELLQAEGRVADAEASYRQALQLTGASAIRFAIATMLPVIYDSAAEVRTWRERLEDNVQALLAAGMRLDPAKEKLPTSFFLAYQGENDRAIQQKIAELCSAGRRDYTGDFPTPAAGGKIRVGFLSSFFKDHTIGQLNRGLVERLDRERFEVVLFSLAAADDLVARQMRAAADRAIELPKDAELARQRVAEERCDLLYYTDIGMSPAAFALATARLAPVQCVTWGHPVTTGLPTIDYFVSSELVEPADAEAHYSERLARLPSLGTYYYRPELPPSPKPRRAFGLDDEHHWYLCPQTLFKFHPDFDELLAEILRRDSRGRIAIIQGRYEHWTELLVRRMHRTMADCVNRVHLVPSQARPDFLSLLAACDVMLDTLHFGGGNTSFEALALGTPVVTLPSPYLRGRITYACYQQMGVLDCVARDRAHYVDLAVRLGTDADFREHVRVQIDAAAGALFEDITAVRAIEQFFQKVARFA